MSIDRPFISITLILAAGLLASPSASAAGVAEPIDLLSLLNDADNAVVRNLIGSADLGLDGALAALGNRHRTPERGPMRPRRVGAGSLGTLGIGAFGGAPDSGVAYPTAYARRNRGVPRADLDLPGRRAVNRVFATLTNAVSDCYGEPLNDGETSLDSLQGAVILGPDGRVTGARLSELPKLASPTIEGCVVAAMRAVTFPAGLVSAPSEVRYRWLFRIAGVTLRFD